jgi:hypothetical protein
MAARKPSPSLAPRKRKTRWIGEEGLPFVNALARAKAELLARAESAAAERRAS